MFKLKTQFFNTLYYGLGVAVGAVGGAYAGIEGSALKMVAFAIGLLTLVLLRRVV